MAGTRRAKFGTLVIELASPGIGYILKAGGAQFVFIDMEHSGFGFDTVEAAPALHGRRRRCRRSCAVPSRHYHTHRPGARRGRRGDHAADGGHSGRKQARIAAHAKYPPHGHRGVALGVATRPLRARCAGDQAARRQQAVARCSSWWRPARGSRTSTRSPPSTAIDGIWIGHFDLSTSLGVPGQFDHPGSHRCAGARGARLRPAQEVVRLPRHECVERGDRCLPRMATT